MVIETVLASSDATRDAIRTIYPDYLESLAPFTDYYHRGPDGSWVPDWLPDWFDDPLRFTYLITVDGAPAGISFVSEAPFPFQTARCDAEVREFYVDPAFRGSGVGRAAAAQCIAHHGARHRSWALTVLQANQPALAFWRTLFADERRLGVSKVREAIEPDEPDVVTFRFEVNPPHDTGVAASGRIPAADPVVSDDRE